MRDMLKAAMVLQGDCKRRFLPVCALDQLFHNVMIERTLEDHRSTLSTDLSSLELYIRSKATRLFAILAWAESEPLIEQFYQRQFRDEHLPVELRINKEDLVEAISYQLGTIGIDEHPFNERQWTDRTMDDFCHTYQWPFLSPVIHQDRFRYRFHELTRMPFMDEQSRSRKESFFSVVEEWSIHRDHIRAPKFIVSDPYIVKSRPLL